MIRIGPRLRCRPKVPRGARDKHTIVSKRLKLPGKGCRVEPGEVHVIERDDVVLSAMRGAASRCRDSSISRPKLARRALLDFLSRGLWCIGRLHPRRRCPKLI